MNQTKRATGRGAQIGCWIILLAATGPLGCDSAQTNRHECAPPPNTAEGAQQKADGAQKSDAPTTQPMIDSAEKAVAAAKATDSISSGTRHTCALVDGGGVKCWGANQYGQLGDGTTEDSPAPVQVVGLNEKVVYVSCGATHTCVRTESGAIQCWGDNRRGQLGAGTYENSSVPTSVAWENKAPQKKNAASRRRKSKPATKSTKIHIPDLFVTQPGISNSAGPNEKNDRRKGHRNTSFTHEFQ